MHFISIIRLNSFRSLQVVNDHFKVLKPPTEIPIFLCSFFSLSTVLLQVSLGLPLFLWQSRVRLGSTLDRDVIGIRSTYPILFHLHIFTSRVIGFVLRGRSQLSTFMKAYTAYARGEGVWDHHTLSPKNQHLFLITDNVL